MKDILQDIIANKRIEVDRQKQAVQLRTLLALGGERLERTTYSMRASLAASSSGIIAEFKRKSPSKGWLHPDAAIPDQHVAAVAQNKIRNFKFIALFHCINKRGGRGGNYKNIRLSPDFKGSVRPHRLVLPVFDILVFKKIRQCFRVHKATPKV